MKTLINKKTNAVLIAITLLFTVSCSYVRTNLIKEGSLQLEIVPSSVTISSVRVYQEGEVTNVLGQVSQQNCDVAAIDGHVDIAFFSPEKKLLYQVSINYEGRKILLRVHATHHHSKHFNRNFKAASPLIPPQGAKIKIAFHNAPFDGSAQNDCGQNMATM